MSFNFQVGLLDNRFFRYCPLCSIDKSTPGGVHYSLFDCWVVSMLWNEVTGWPDSKRSPAFLICNPNWNQNDLMKINLFLFCLIKLNSAKFARVEYPQDFPHEQRPSVLNHFEVDKMVQQVKSESASGLVFSFPLMK
ncbi:unnamed protein product [Ambrosiozyma monospora]|uniref:Unnamed protein product n=1 Tax=Ambrosiozyma monospora TaxID=43982 RepID=A0ACB5TBA3_AMBMO|nr:unnamed protein product [Ambrosiozyma monospora]